MSRIFAIMKRDFEHVRHNVIALLVCMGLAIMPSLYAWFNIAGGWDPYGNTGQLQVALAISDEGIEGSLIPFRVNVGERVLSSLAGSTKIGYVITSEEEAIDGVYSGKYYAAVVIPPNFSTNLLSVFTKSPSHPTFDYYVNQKRNPIASIVAGKASGSIQTMIDEDFTAAVTETTTELVDELSTLLDDDNLLSLASSLGSVIDDSVSALRRSADDITAYQSVIASVRSVMNASDSLLGNNSLSINASSKLAEAADGVRAFDSKINAAEEAASSAIDTGISKLQDVEAAIDEAFDVADGKTDELIEALNKAKEVATSNRDALQNFRDLLDDLNGQVYSFAEDVEVRGLVTTTELHYVHTLTNDVSDLLARTDNALAYLNELIDTLQTTIDDISTAQGDAATNRTKLKELAAQARESIEEMRNSYNDNLSGSLANIANVIDDAAADAANVSATLQNEIDTLTPILSGATSGLANLESTLADAACKINEAANKLDALHAKLKAATSSGDLELVRTIFGSDPDALMDFFSAPVELDREAVYAIENNGSAMAPYYTTMALWVGGTLMGILFYTGLSERALEETKAKPRHAYFGRLAFFLAVGFLQSTTLLLGDLYFLGIQCEEPLLFLLTGWLASFVFINIIYSLSTSFGDVGKAIGVLFMVVQVAGSGGTFPVEMLPKLFQTLYKFLPFVYSETAMREAICGVYGNAWINAMGTLALYLVPALLLGLVLRKPFVPVNEWIEEHLEETKFM